MAPPLQYSCLENPVGGGAWWAAVHGVAKSRIWLSDFTFTVHFHASEKEMATHSSVLAWRIPGKGEPGGLPSLGSHKVGHDWNDAAVAAAAAGRELYAETAQSALTVILKLIIGGLTSVVSYILSTDNLQSHGRFVPVSLRPVLRILAAYVMATVWSSCS